jgi:hypothetical protein
MTAIFTPVVVRAEGYISTAAALVLRLGGRATDDLGALLEVPDTTIGTR